MALGFQRQGMFGRKMPDYRSPWETPGIGDGINQQMGQQQSQPMPIGIEQMQQPKKPGFFGQGGVGRAIAGTIGDFLLQQSGMQPIYGPTVLQQRDAEESARMAQQQRMQRREDMQWEWQNKPKDVNPYRWESNDGSLLEIGPDGQPRVVYKDPTPKTTYITSDNGDGTKTIVPIVNGVPQMGGQQPLIPIGGTLPPKGGSGGNVTGGFQRP